GGASRFSNTRRSVPISTRYARLTPRVCFCAAQPSRRSRRRTSAPTISSFVACREPATRALPLSISSLGLRLRLSAQSLVGNNRQKSFPPFPLQPVLQLKESTVSVT